jgi:hypothetical protein
MAETEWFKPGVPVRPQRVMLAVPVRYRSVGEGPWHTGRTENISQSGVLVRGIRLFSQNARVEVVLTVPAGLVTGAAGETIFVGKVARLLPPAIGGGLPGLAIAFEKYRAAESANTARPDNAAAERK